MSLGRAYAVGYRKKNSNRSGMAWDDEEGKELKASALLEQSCRHANRVVVFAWFGIHLLPSSSQHHFNLVMSPNRGYLQHLRQLRRRHCSKELQFLNECVPVYRIQEECRAIVLCQHANRATRALLVHPVDATRITRVSWLVSTHLTTQLFLEWGPQVFTSLQRV